MDEEQNTLDEMLTTQQVARIFNIAEITLVKWRCAGTGPDYFRLASGHVIRYWRSEVARYIKVHRVHPRAKGNARKRCREAQQVLTA